MTDKEYEKVVKKLDLETVNDMQAMSVEELKAKCVQAQQSIAATKKELDENEEYQALKENVKAMSAGLRDVKSRQNAVSDLAVHLIEEKGK